MRFLRHLTTLILLVLAATSIRAQTQDQPRDSIVNPSDLDFHARLVADSHSYHMGEPVEIELSYSTNAEKKYQTSRSNPNPDWGGAVRLSPIDGAIRLIDLRNELITSFAGSILSGGPEFLTPTPITERLDLSLWYRIQKPGHYSVFVSSENVWQMETLEEGGGRQNLRLESNAVEFEILPPDPAWESAELASITQALDAAKYPGDRYVAIHRLAALGTPAAVNKLIDLFLANPSDYSEGSAVYAALRESSQTDLMIPRLQAALANPSSTIPQRTAELLALLETRAELGMPGSPPSDSAQQPAWRQKLNERMKVRDKYLARANAELVASIRLRTGPQHAQAIFQAWTDAEQLNFTSPQPAEYMSQLQQEALNVQRELTPPQRLQLVTASLKTVPHEQLLPIIRELTNVTGEDAWSYVHSAYELWCKDERAECSVDILRRAAKSDPLINQHVIFLMPEAEHSELDKMLQEKLADPKIVWGGAASINLSALVLRAGSKNLAPSVDTALDQNAIVRKYDCEAQAYLLGYVFRFAQKDAIARLSAIVQTPADVCANQMFGYLSNSRYSDELIPIAIAALNSQNLNVVESSGFLIANHAPESAKAALWQRLEALRHNWHDRAAEVQPSSFSYGNSPAELASHLEQSLASALVNATNWKLSDAERDRLREGCLTEQCRNVADGKMRIGM
jgi:hypothetical protein